MLTQTATPAAGRRIIPPLPENPQLTMAYVPYQNMDTVYEADQALTRGTLFPELDKPFYGERGFSV
jgi:hypothetical protein